MSNRTNIVKCKTHQEKEIIYKGWEWQNVLNKTQFAKQYGISVRTLNRILDEFKDDKVCCYDYTVTKNQITIFCNEDSRSVAKDYPKFKSLRTKLMESDFSDEVLAEVYELLNLPKFVEKFSEGNITVDHENGKVFYGTFEIKNSVVDRMMLMLDGREDIKPLVKFLEKLMMNPKTTVIEELYPFLKHNDIEISEDGDIIAYRSVRHDWKDFHTGTMDNSIGTVVSMPRTLVDDDPNRTCSSGIHCASFEYASTFGSGNSHLVKVQVCPSDVVSVPTDYNGMKLRACKLKVLEEVL
jgi:hypothetical protein